MSDLIDRQESKDISEINKFIDGLEEIFADIRERHGDDSVCGLCEYDGAYMGQSGDWCNECPGFDKDDCFKLSDETRKKWIEKIVNAYPDHVADVGKKVAEEDCINRQAAIDSLHGYFDGMLETDTWSPCDVYGLIELLPSAQPEPHWIPCSERLPEEQRYCLTSCRNGLVCEDFHWNNGYFDKADKYHHEVIAWMPLPEPYRGGDSE